MAIDNMISALIRVGYDVQDAHQRDLGLAAYGSCTVVCDSANLTARAAAQPRRVGRNEKCPCGSGKKYKKCCIDKARQVPRHLHLSPETNPELIPCLFDNAALQRDLITFCGLLETDPSLKRIRFDGQRAATYLKSRTDADPELVEAGRLDEVAQDYFAAEEQAGALGQRTMDAIAEAAGRTHDIDALRSLALGMNLAATLESEAAVANPLVSALFRLSVDEMLRTGRALIDLTHALVGDAPRSSLLSRLPDPSDMQRALEQVGGSQILDTEALYQVFERQVEELGKDIRAGKMPVLLPLTTVLPGMAAVLSLPPNASPEENKSQASRILADMLEQLHEEDVKLFRETLAAWLNDEANAEAPARALVTTIYAISEAGNLEPLDFHLLVASLMDVQDCDSPPRVTLSLEADDEQVESLPDDFLAPEFLEAYASALEKQGYPALARRTRAIEPPGLHEKHAAE